MRRSPLVTALLVLAGLLGLAVTALAEDRSQAFTLGVVGASPIAIPAGSVACQAPIGVPADAGFAAIRFALGTYGRPGPAVDVRVRELGTRRLLGHGGIAAGYPDVDRRPQHTVPVGHVPAGRVVSVCLANRGSRKVAVYGNAAAASRTSEASIDGRPVPVDIDLSFQRRTPRSLASLTGAMFHRAALFRATWVGSWTYATLAVLLALGVGTLLVLAVRSAVRTGV